MTNEWWRKPGSERSPYWAAVETDLCESDKQFSPAAERNAQPIEDVLFRWLPRSGAVLEVASGPGQHVARFASRFPDIIFTPSDPDSSARASTKAWTAGLANVAAPRPVDVADPRWHETAGGPFDAVLAINLLHIAPWSVTLGLMLGAADVLLPGGHLLVYGCFSRDGRHLSDSNAAFDASLRARDPAWGVRDVGETAAAAAFHGLLLVEDVAMPSNNMMLVFSKPE
jgi:hypothetical protein